MNTPRLRLLSLALLAAGMAQAQQAQQAPQQLDKVVVTGQAASLRSALDKQRNATGVVSIVHADGIGQLPDANAAEALARLPGVSVERDQGEGRFVRVRGLGPDLNAVSINGSLAPAAEADRRAPGLDLLPAGLIRSLEVHKTLLPEQDAQALGGLVAVNTLSAFDLAGPLLALELGANHDANAGKSRPRASLVHAQRFGRFGSALAISFDERRFASDNVETGGAWDGDALEEFDRRRYEITRERLAAAFNLDWREGAQQLWLRGFASRFTDDEARQSHALAFEEAQTEGQTGAAEAVRSLKSRREQSRMEALSLGGQWPLADGLLKAELGASRASESKPDGIGAAEFLAEFDEGIGFRDSRGPRLIAPAAVNQAAGHELDKIEFEQGLSRDRARHLKLDLSQALGEAIEVKLGLKLGRRTKTNAEEITAIDAGDLDGEPFAMSAFLLPARVDYAFGDFGPGLAAAPLVALRRGLNLAEFRDEEASTVNDFRLQERNDAAYVQFKGEGTGWQWLAGVRHERLSFEADGYGLREGELETVRATTRSRHWLPALLWRQDIDADTRWRAAYTSSLVRPSFGQLAPGFVVDGDEAETGNPLLKPLRSRNLDLGIERRLNGGGALSAYLFAKQIRDFSYQTDLAGSGAWPDFSEVISYANGDRARVQGLELNWQQALRRLPAPWNGLVIGANASFVRSKATIAGYDEGVLRSRRISLPSQSDRTLNLSLGWESPDLSLRLALNHKSRYLLEVGHVLDAAQDSYVAAQQQIDFSLRWNLAPQWQLGVEALNLGNEAYYVHQPDAARNVQLERYGRAVKLNLKWTAK